MFPLPSEPAPRPERRAPWYLAGALALVAVAAFAAAGHLLAKERRALVERRLSGAAEILTAPAREVLTGGLSREAFLARLLDLGSTTGLRITLIDPQGEALADSEVPGRLPNLADRPEVREASIGGHSAAARRSVVTGKETVYVAHAVVVDGQRLGTIRAATESGELDGVLGGIEALCATGAAAALGLGILLGLRIGVRKPAEGRVHPLERSDRAAA